MATRMDFVQPREWTSANGSGTEWVTIGKAWMNDDGTGSVEFTALPLPAMNSKTGKMETRVLLRFPKARDDAPRQQARPLADDFDAAPF